MDTSDPDRDRDGGRTASLGILGVGAAACAACCAGPILGLLAATGIASLLGAVAFGVAGLVVVLAIAAVLYQRRRRARRCSTSTTTTRSRSSTVVTMHQ